MICKISADDIQRHGLKEARKIVGTMWEMFAVKDTLNSDLTPDRIFFLPQRQGVELGEDSNGNKIPPKLYDRLSKEATW